MTAGVSVVDEGIIVVVDEVGTGGNLWEFCCQITLAGAKGVVALGIPGIEVGVAIGVGTVSGTVTIVIEEITARGIGCWWGWGWESTAVFIRCTVIFRKSRDLDAAAADADEMGAALTLTVLRTLRGARSRRLCAATTHAGRVGFAAFEIYLAEILSGTIGYPAGSEEALEVGGSGGRRGGFRGRGREIEGREEFRRGRGGAVTIDLTEITPLPDDHPTTGTDALEVDTTDAETAGGGGAGC